MFFKKIKFFIISAVGVLISCPAVAQSNDYGLSDTASAAGLTRITSIPSLIGSVLGTAISLVGIIFFALMLYGGIVWMTARGNAENEKKALGTITSAIIGILIVLGSYAITNFVFKSVGADSGSVPVNQTTPKTPSSTPNPPDPEGDIKHDRDFFIGWWESFCLDADKAECEKNKFCQVFDPPQNGQSCDIEKNFINISQAEIDIFCLEDPTALEHEEYWEFCRQTADFGV